VDLGEFLPARSTLDEIHLVIDLTPGDDPLDDFPVPSACSCQRPGSQARFFLLTSRIGLCTQVVSPMDSIYYPKLIGRCLGPTPVIQLCVFHVIKTSTRASSMQCGPAMAVGIPKQADAQPDAGGAPRHRKPAHARQGTTRKDQAYYIWKRRHLLVTRPDHLTPENDASSFKCSIPFRTAPAADNSTSTYTTCFPTRSAAFVGLPTSAATLVNHPRVFGRPRSARALAY